MGKAHLQSYFSQFIFIYSKTTLTNKKMHNIKKIYLYLVSLVSLVIIIVAAIMLINMALKTWVFTKADKDIYYYPRCAEMTPPAPAVEGSLAKAPACNEEEEKKRAEESRAAQKQRDAAQAIAMLLVATPVFYFHWRIARKES